MPLPEGWNGVFYGKETGGDMIFDLEPEAFIDLLEREDVQDSHPFLVAGAYCDLLLNNNEARADLFLEAGRKKWSEEPWDRLKEFAAKATPMLRGRDDSQASQAYSEVVSRLFNASFLLAIVSW